MTNNIINSIAEMKAMAKQTVTLNGTIWGVENLTTLHFGYF
jgi:hypothetical protein